MITLAPAPGTCSYSWSHASGASGLVHLNYDNLYCRVWTRCCSAPSETVYKDRFTDECSLCGKPTWEDLGPLDSPERQRQEMRKWSEDWAQAYVDPLSATLVADQWATAVWTLIGITKAWEAEQTGRYQRGQSTMGLYYVLRARWNADRPKLQALCDGVACSV